MLDNGVARFRCGLSAKAGADIADRRLSGIEGRDFIPVAKLFTPDANAVWLLTELDPQGPDLAFGLCDLGMGHPDVGYVSLAEIAAVRGPAGRRVERDPHFVGAYPLSVYTRAAHAAEAVTEDEKALYRAAMALAADRSVSE